MQYNKVCPVCGKEFRGAYHKKTDSDACRKTLSRRKKDASNQAYDAVTKIQLLSDSFRMGAIDEDYALRLIQYIQVAIDRFGAQITIRH